MFSARLYPMITKKSLKKIENPELRLDGLSVFSDSKNTGNALILTFLAILFQGPKRVKSSLALNWLKVKFTNNMMRN